MGNAKQQKAVIKLAGQRVAWETRILYFFSRSTLALLDLVTTGFWEATVLALFTKGVSTSEIVAGLFLAFPAKGVLGFTEDGGITVGVLVLSILGGQSDDLRK